MITVLSLISLPDVPLLLFWTLSLQALSSAVFGGRRSGWIAAGLCMGLAFDSKYTGLLLQLGLVLFLLWSRPHRPPLRTRWPRVSLPLAHAVMLPVSPWHAQYGVASILLHYTTRA